MIILHFDYPSAASAIALVRLQAVADAGGSVAFSGLDTLGLDVAVPATLDQLEEYERVRARALELGLPLRRPTLRPPTTLAHLVGDLAEDRGLGASWRSTCLHAFWSRGADLGDESVLVALAGQAGLDGAEVLAHLGDRPVRLAARQRSAAQRRRGIGGVPVLEVGGSFVSPDLPDADLQALAAL